MPILALILALTAGPAWAQSAEIPDQAQVVDRLVAVVGDRIITASDVRLERVLAKRDPSPVAPLRLRQQADPEALLIDAAVVRNLAGNIAIYAPSTTEVSQRVAALRATWAAPAGWRSFLSQAGLDEERLAGRLYARMVVEAYVRRNVGLATSAATPAGSAAPVDADALYLDWIEAERALLDIRRVAPLAAP